MTYYICAGGHSFLSGLFQNCKLLPFLITLLILLTGMNNAASAQVKWDGGSSGTGTSWTQAANWSPDGVPTILTDVVIDNSITAHPASCTVSSAMGAKTITFSNHFNAANTTLLGCGSSSARVFSFPAGWSFTNNATSGTVTFQPQNGATGNLSFTLGGSGTVSVAAGGSVVLSVVIAQSATSGITKTGAGTLVLSGANSYTGGTTITAGTLTLGAAGVLADAGGMILNGGTFKSGITAGFSETMGILTLNASSVIALGTGNHTLRFAASNATTWSSGKMLTVTGWTGTPGATGTEGKITFGSASGLTTAQLAQVQFLIGGTYYPVAILPGGEIVPSGSTLHAIRGIVTYNNLANTPLTGAEYTLELFRTSDNNSMGSTHPGSDGTYAFTNLSPGDYYIVGSSTHTTAGSVNTTDAAQVNNWCTQPSEIEKVRFYAGDVTGSSFFINSTDAQRIQQNFTHGTAFDRNGWTFWKAGETINSNTIQTDSWPHVTLTAAGDLIVNIYGLCTGDFNGSFDPGLSKAMK